MYASFGCKPDQFAPQTRSTLGVGGLDWACKRGRSLAWKKKRLKKEKDLKNWEMDLRSKTFCQKYFVHIRIKKFEGFIMIYVSNVTMVILMKWVAIGKIQWHD